MAARFPFTPFPSGWFLLVYSDELPPLGVVPLKYFGSDLVLFRGEDGQPYLLDAYCPHLGAHLGYGGKICGNTLRCPFHGWRFDGAGQCVEIPGCKKIPAKARVPSWPLREQDGLIMVYHHPTGAAPDYEPQRIPEYGDPRWTTAYRMRWQVRTHPQDMTENAVDNAHFVEVHHWSRNPECKTLELRGPFLHTLMQGAISVDGTNILDVTLRVRAMGLGWIDTFADIGVSYHVIDTFTPVDGELVEVRTMARILKNWPESETEFEAMALADVKLNIEEDIKILERRRYTPAPILSEADGPISTFRRWARQFHIVAAAEA